MFRRTYYHSYIIATIALTTIFGYITPESLTSSLAFFYVDFCRIMAGIKDAAVHLHQFAHHELMKGVNGYDRKILGSGLKRRRSFDK
ncbi:MAG: hypothetical protein ACLTMM_02005 [Lachnospiraceae bacterium]